MSGRKSRSKGRRIELEFRHEIEDYGIPCRRRQESGIKGNPDDPDLLVAGCLTAESKGRKGGAGFVQIERWLGENDILFLKRNNKPPMAVMPFDVFKCILLAWYEGGAPTTWAPEHTDDEETKQ